MLSGLRVGSLLECYHCVEGTAHPELLRRQPPGNDEVHEEREDASGDLRDCSKPCLGRLRFQNTCQKWSMWFRQRPETITLTAPDHHEFL